MAAPVITGTGPVISVGVGSEGHARQERNEGEGNPLAGAAPPMRSPHSMTHYVYMLASRRHGTLYVGVTNDLSRRVGEHRSKAVSGFSARYDVTRLVWYEGYERIDEAIAREKALKKWRRDWKIRLIEEMDPEWQDLYLALNQ
jgi:putative endonuclease